MALISRPSSLNPNADPFLYTTTPFPLPPPKLEFLPIPIFKPTPPPPPRVLWAATAAAAAPPLHGYGSSFLDPYYQYQHPPMFGFYDVVPAHLPNSFPPCSDTNNNGDHHHRNTKTDQKKWTIKKWAPSDFMPSETTQTTTLMIKNIPNQFRRHHLLSILDDHCKWKNQSSDHSNNSFDFLYLPMDFRKYWYDGKISNLGYAFVNFTTPTAASDFSEAFHRRQWDVLVNRKVCEIKRAKLQGLKALMEAFRNKIFWCHSNNYLPVVLEPPSDGCCSRYRATPVGKRIARPPPSPIKKCG